VIEDPQEPPIHFAGYGEPLSPAQLDRLAVPQPRK
jgi:hypothetical protein